MNTRDAKQILLLYRGTIDDSDPQFHAALAYAKSDPELSEAVDVIDPAPPADVLAERSAILRLVDQLPAKQRQVIMLFYMEEQSHEEMASMLAMPVGTVKTLLHRARARLSAAAGKVSATA